ncbi:DUF3021 domain-containing protein, partial [Lactobacillus sp. XV13L]|nr:DUF3021 domain-containing protein [Lactobacillus sp. XV13L]
MKNFKDIITRSLMSAPIGVTIGLAIAIIYSLASHSEHVQPSTEQFIRQFATPVQAFLASMFLWALIGMLYGGSSVCFVQERWSITRQTVTHFFITYISYTLLAIIAGWMPLSLKFL